MERRPSSSGPEMCTCVHARERHGHTAKPRHTVLRQAHATHDHAYTGLALVNLAHPELAERVAYREPASGITSGAQCVGVLRAILYAPGRSPQTWPPPSNAWHVRS